MLGLSPELNRAIADQGYTEPTPIQAQAIPKVLAGSDLLAAAQTGTGKTAAFVLPMLYRLSQTPRPPVRAPRALVLVPTRELAAQVAESVRDYGRHLPLRSTVIFGGVSFRPQVEAVRRGADVVVATPGRLLDHVQQRTIDLSHIAMLVLDEADRMLDMGFIHDIKRILALLPANRQNLLFSATFNPEIRALASSFLSTPAVVEVAARNATADRITQVAHPVAGARKLELLIHLISKGNWEQVLVFARTKHGANRLAEQLTREGISSDAIHGNKSQNHRTKALSDFKRGSVRVLVATDIAARGLDIEALPHVVNYDLPQVPEDYVHRIGRTGRAGAEGQAVSLVIREEERLLYAIERVTANQIPRVVVPGFEIASSGPSVQRMRSGAGRSSDSRSSNSRSSDSRIDVRDIRPVSRYEARSNDDRAPQARIDRAAPARMDDRADSPRGRDSRSFETRAFEPRALEPRVLETRSFEARDSRSPRPEVPTETRFPSRVRKTEPDLEARLEAFLEELEPKRSPKAEPRTRKRPGLDTPEPRRIVRPETRPETRSDVRSELRTDAAPEVRPVVKRTVSRPATTEGEPVRRETTPRPAQSLTGSGFRPLKRTAALGTAAVSAAEGRGPVTR